MGSKRFDGAEQTLNLVTIKEPYSRVSVVQSLLATIRPFQGKKGRRQVPATAVSARGAVVVVANESSHEPSYRDWLFRTIEPNVWGYYAEEWVPQEKNWCLKQIALHLYTVATPNARKEMFAFHCEPSHEGEAVLDCCKRGPHVHVTAADSRLAHAHIPLQLTNLDSVLASADALTDFIRTAMEVIEVDVIPRFAG